MKVYNWVNECCKDGWFSIGCLFKNHTITIKYLKYTTHFSYTGYIKDFVTLEQPLTCIKRLFISNSLWNSNHDPSQPVAENCIRSKKFLYRNQNLGLQLPWLSFSQTKYDLQNRLKIKIHLKLFGTGTCWVGSWNVGFPNIWYFTLYWPEV